MNFEEKHNSELEEGVSIIIPIYNRENLIIESLKSIKNQTFSNWECIIVDDRSEDNSVKVIKEFIKNDPRFKLYIRPIGKIKGANSCRNYGREKAIGNYIHWFDSDDIAHPKYLEVSYNLINNTDYDFCRFSRTVFWGDFNYNFKEIPEKVEIKKISSNHIQALLKNELVFNTCSVLWKKASLKNEFFNEEIVYADEWEYYSRLLSNKLNGISIAVELFFGRKHPSSTTFEFANNDPIRKASKIKAVNLVVDNLLEKKLLSESLILFFIRLGFSLNELSIITRVLRQTKKSVFFKYKYRFGFYLYPILRPILKLKGDLLNKT